MLHSAYQAHIRNNISSLSLFGDRPIDQTFLRTAIESLDREIARLNIMLDWTRAKAREVSHP
ncbi:hypothetical protein CDL15_Pgr023423 [Punica granatum]|uniref:Uncharacterized protein n=1 Tax=Punica granatum TaxID=22663 RepID=A0A218XQV2_PUNGR|nr:hypothetical protein CDL15_Pgr023423 [Punica granatum]